MPKSPHSLPLILLLATQFTACANLLINDRESDSPQPQQRWVRLPAGDIALGMSEGDVLRNWGDPLKVQQAGSDSTRRQRWIYLNESTKSWGSSQARIVYFQQGAVVGWETTSAPE